MEIKAEMTINIYLLDQCNSIFINIKSIFEIIKLFFSRINILKYELFNINTIFNIILYLIKKLFN